MDSVSGDSATANAVMADITSTALREIDPDCIPDSPSAFKDVLAEVGDSPAAAEGETPGSIRFDTRKPVVHELRSATKDLLDELEVVGVGPTLLQDGG